MADSDEQQPASRRVWDAPVRIFHWAIVGLVVTSWVTADQGFMRIHQWSGSALLALLLFRLAWGLFGSSTARFSGFVRSPFAAFRYLRALSRSDPPKYAGHNPAGGWMVLALLSLLCAQVTTGLFANDGLGFMGPLALQVAADDSDRLTSLHGWLFNLLLLLVWLHVVAVFFYLLVKRENLILPMLTGRKPAHLMPGGHEPRMARLWIAAILFAIAAGVAWWVVWA